MEIVISHEEKKYIFKPKTIEEAICQNIENIITRTKGNVILARHKGIIAENIDKPQIVVEAEITADIVEELDREEKKFKIQEIKITSSSEVKTFISANLKGEIVDVKVR